ncbi:hypothetical protein JOF42_003530 [Microbacterium phyllosphaerae]|uniref:NadR/Ttd14 AAA domain-containing protein n=1 Tax=Microbacterium phyllosphaerae TaxID=124798 RepID=A0ABS4WV02_9MICO|nr:AAA family ATPase [Microbacterium phyllosphaerae]MBP2380035.1 hypothetical protein [Microbacterium phyllosphaerae]
MSGTHASGKSTLISDFHAAHPEYAVLGDPFDDIESEAPAGAASFVAQLRVTVSRLRESAGESSVISERGSIDFLAYLTALDALGRGDDTLLSRAQELVESSMADVDLIAVVPLDPRHAIAVPDDEDPELREAMGRALLDVLDDLERAGDAPSIVTLTGSPGERLTQLEKAAGLC